MAAAAAVVAEADPLEHNGAKVEIARGLVEAGAAIMIPESRLTPETLATQIETILAQPDAALQMSLAAMSVGKPEAAEALAQMVEAHRSQGGHMVATIRENSTRILKSCTSEARMFRFFG